MCTEHASERDAAASGRTAPADDPGDTRNVDRPTRLRSRYVDLDRVRVRYYVAGDDDAPPVVLLHGGGLDEARLSWRHTITGLADVARVYALDWPGYGASGPPAERATLDYYADVLVEFLDAVDVDRATLVGISMGGGVALRAAIDTPERVSRLVLVDSYGLGSTVPGGRLASWFTGLDRTNRLLWAVLGRSRRLVRWTIEGITVSPDSALVDDAVTALSRPAAGRAWRAFQRHEVLPAGLRTAFVEDLPHLDRPTLLVHGEQDPLVPVDWAVRAATLLPDAELRVLSNCGHMPPRERPEAFDDAVRTFLDQPM
ncbi:alpha/beta fold hydrolase [Haloarchaeobius baliensis]|uniref:alpha/beta fold hydrolase n=1 Tax=Haloarchaeobius baliensis TaxID=1670458 RepID=UPI003F883534